MSTALRILSLCFLTCQLLSFSASAQSAAAEATLTVRLLLYSGRPDPVFVLTNEALTTARPLLEKAQENMRHQVKGGCTIIPSILGYKGILVDNPAGLEGLPKRFAVFNGQIEGLGRKRIIFPDRGRDLERFLLRQAVRQGVISERTLKRLKMAGDKSSEEE